MRVSFDPEDGRVALGDNEPGNLVGVDSVLPSEGAASAVEPAPPYHSERVSRTIDQAMAGALPLGRKLEPWEPSKLNPTHIQMCMDRAGGLTASEIAVKYDYGEIHTKAILRHPFAVQVIGSLMAMEADKATDIHARLQGYAHEMINVKLSLMQETVDLRLKNAIASDLLDRAGYGARQQVDLNATHRFAVPAAAAQVLAQALIESKRVAVVDYTAFTGGPTAQESGALLSTVLEPEQLHILSAASPEPLSAPTSAELHTLAAEHDEREWASETKARRIA